MSMDSPPGLLRHAPGQCAFSPICQVPKPILGRTGQDLISDFMAIIVQHNVTRDRKRASNESAIFLSPHAKIISLRTSRDRAPVFDIRLTADGPMASQSCWSKSSGARAGCFPCSALMGASLSAWWKRPKHTVNRPVPRDDRRPPQQRR